MKKIQDGYELVNGRVLKKCRHNQIRNPRTMRCNKQKAIPYNYEMVNGRILKKCNANQVRNPITGRCRINKNLKKSPAKSPIKLPAKQPTKLEAKREPTKREAKREPKPAKIPTTNRSDKRSLCNSIHILNENNSCYLDSLLVALFHKQNPYIYKIFFDSEINHKKHTELYNKALNIREELQDKNLLITGITKTNSYKYCRQLRKMLNDYKSIYNKTFPNRKLEDNDWQRQQSDPVQTLQFLDIIFGFPYKSKFRIQNWGTNDSLSKSKLSDIVSHRSPLNTREENRNFIYSINGDELFGKEKINLKEFLPSKVTITHFDNLNRWRVSNGNSYETKVEKVVLIDTPVLFVHIDRLIIDPATGDIEKIPTIVKPEVTINTKSRQLKLRSIIIHHGSEDGGHYTCVIKCDHKWYEYDDLSHRLQLVGSLQDVYDKNRNYYMKNCTDFVYF